jgi:hypothetical protein
MKSSSVIGAPFYRPGHAPSARSSGLVVSGHEFKSLNPYGKIPAIIDPDGPGGKPLGLFETGAILLYLAEKTARLLPKDPARRYETIQWLVFQVAGLGPIFGQVGFFHKFAGKDFEDKRPRDRYVGESKHVGFYGAGDLVGFGDYPNVKRTLEIFVQRPAVDQRAGDSEAGITLDAIPTRWWRAAWTRCRRSRG